MSLEIEAKIKVDSHDALRARLVELGAQRLGKVKETNRIFDGGTKSLRKQGKGLRVRHIEVMEGESVRSSITFKGKVQSAKFKTRPEIELQIDDPDQAARILEALGYEAFITFEKIRETWRLGTCNVELDEVPLLGKFVEIEGPNESDVEHVRSSLGLGSAEHLPRSYINMLLKFCKTAGIDSRIIRFNS